MSSSSFTRKPSGLSINLYVVNMDEEPQTNDAHDETMETTYRHDGLSIGKDYLRLDHSNFSRGELFPSRLAMENTLGRGSYCRVVKAKWKSKYEQDEKFVALKQFPLHSSKHEGMLTKELKTLAKVDCECLLKLLGAFREEHYITVALEYMDQGSIGNLIQRGERLTEPVLVAITYQMLWGLAYLHHEKMMHRDIKPENVLLNSDGYVKLADFGIASTGREMTSTIVGTAMYMAPERLRGKPYGMLSDLWSLGLVIWECATGKQLFQGMDSMIELIQTIDEMASVDNLIPSELSDGIAEILRGCLQKSPGKRLPSTLLLQSPWFRGNDIAVVADATSIMRDYFASQPANENQR